MIDKRIPYSNIFFLLIASVIGLTYMLIISNTYDLGDSLTHYFISKYSWTHLNLFLDNWGKPVFTFLSSPFTQFDWIGMKVFNTLVGVATAFILSKIIQKELPAISPYWALVLFCIPNWVLSLNSGLTEPLFALFVLAALYSSICNNHFVAALIISFLPMVRNEGYIIMAIYACYYILKYQWKAFALLSVGTIFISIIGYLTEFDTLLWFFKTNPYVSKFSNYGKGDWVHYFDSYYYMTGIPFTILSVVSVLYFIYKKLRLDSLFKNPDTMIWLCLGTFSSYFFAHVIFWKFGLFNSFGMNRVLLSVIPLMLIPICYLVAEMKFYFKPTVYSLFTWITVLLLIIFPYSGNKSGFILPRDFKLSDEIDMNLKVITRLKEKKINYTKIYVSAPVFLFCIDKDPFDKSIKSISAIHDDTSFTNSIIVFDNWYSVMEHNTSEDYIIKKIGMDKFLLEEKTSEGAFLKVFYIQ